jgi:hypothetical protein
MDNVQQEGKLKNNPTISLRIKPGTFWLAA